MLRCKARDLSHPRSPRKGPARRGRRRHDATPGGFVLVGSHRLILEPVALSHVKKRRDVPTKCGIVDVHVGAQYAVYSEALRDIANELQQSFDEARDIALLVVLFTFHAATRVAVDLEPSGIGVVARSLPMLTPSQSRMDAGLVVQCSRRSRGRNDGRRHRGRRAGHGWEASEQCSGVDSHQPA